MRSLKCHKASQLNIFDGVVRWRVLAPIYFIVWRPQTLVPMNTRRELTCAYKRKSQHLRVRAPSAPQTIQTLITLKRTKRASLIFLFNANDRFRLGVYRAISPSLIEKTRCDVLFAINGTAIIPAIYNSLLSRSTRIYARRRSRLWQIARFRPSKGCIYLVLFDMAVTMIF